MKEEEERNSSSRTVRRSWRSCINLGCNICTHTIRDLVHMYAELFVVKGPHICTDGKEMVIKKSLWH